jgi:hypothetical protein
MLPDEQTAPEQYESFRRMTPERRLALAEQLYWTARELKAAWLRRQHTDWSEDQITRETTRLFTHART